MIPTNQQRFTGFRRPIVTFPVPSSRIQFSWEFSVMLIRLGVILAIASCLSLAAAAADSLPEKVKQGMRQSTHYFHTKVASNGGYVYLYSLDLASRWGEGKASASEIWVQPPGTPTVGMAFLAAYQATGERLYLDAAVDAAKALIHGQLESGGWTASIDFDPAGPRADRYRNGHGRGKGKNYSTLDDDKTQAALCLLMSVDKTLDFKDPVIHQSVNVALDALLKAQFPNGGFPQGWRQPVSPQPIMSASFPDYDWRSSNRLKDYWDYYTLNDGLAGTAARTLDLAHQIYGDDRYRSALIRLGDFLLLAQMPEPQTGWAQQYDFNMRPIWARKFEPPAISGAESVDAMETLMFIYEVTREPKYLKAVSQGVAWLKRSLLPDGQMARFYELQTNRPLYLTRDTYELTYDDSNLPTHYSFKAKSKVERIEKQLNELVHGGVTKRSVAVLKTLERDAITILSELDSEGRWTEGKDGKPLLAGQPATNNNAVISSERFSKNLERLSEYLQAIAAESK